ncbi:MAG: helix-turn-helix transcriptional regulator [Spirosomataceae bacterium]
MTSLFNHLPTGHSKSYSNSTVTVYFSEEYVGLILPFLINHQIPFTLSAFHDSSENENKATTALNTPKDDSEKEEIKKNLSDIEVVFQKYIVEGIEKFPPNVEEIAAELNMSVAVFGARFRKAYGKSFYQVYLDRKMDYAATLLKAGLNAIAVSTQIGYSHPIKFNKMFQKHFGMTPKKYQMLKRLKRKEQ